MVAGEDAEAAGGNRQRFVKAELGGKIGDGILVELGRVGVAPGLRVVEVVVKLAQHSAGAGGKAGVLQPGAQFLVGNFAQHGDGVVKHILPAARRKFVEKILGFLVPASTRGCGTVFSGRPRFR